MKQLKQFISEALKINSKSKVVKTKHKVETKDELIGIIKDRYNKSTNRKLDCSDLDVSNVTDFSEIFKNCRKIETIDISGWDISNADSLEYMFASCNSLYYIIGLSDLDVSKVNYFDYMFCMCSSIKQLDLSNWKIDTANKPYITIIKMFAGCVMLKNIKGIEKFSGVYKANAKDLFANNRYLNLNEIYKKLNLK